MKGLITTLLICLTEAAKLEAHDDTANVSNLDGSAVDLSELSQATNVNIFNFYGPIYGSVYGLDDGEASDKDGDEGDQSEDGGDDSNQGTGGYYRD